ncbi:MAG: FAD-binding protein [Desulforhopalus sp.]
MIGCGYSGAVSALEAAGRGASVCILEKAPHPGGISICSAGGLRITTNEDAALQYLEATNKGTTPSPVLAALAKGMARLPEYVRQLAKINNAQVSVRPWNANYPFPGYDSFGFVYIDNIPDVDIAQQYPHVKGNPAGALLFNVLEANLKQKEIPVYLSTPVVSLCSKEGRVTGVELANGEKLEASRGVILACGGFEADHEMQRQFWPGGPCDSAAYKYNTGDGIRMAQAMGADLWHMWHYHACYGFSPPSAQYPFGIRIKRLPDWVPDKKTNDLPPMTWVLLDQKGKRFMNEYEPYVHDTGARPMSVYDPIARKYPRNPAFLITDEPGRLSYPLGKPLYNDPKAKMDWSPDNSKEIENGTIVKAKTIRGLAEKLGLPAEATFKSIEKWNNLCRDKLDPTFSRPPASMHSISTPPFYGAPMVPVISNTQGGPRHDERQRVLNPYGEPIPGLYAVGECGSCFGFLYMSGGNLAECFVGGQIAGIETSRHTIE